MNGLGLFVLIIYLICHIPAIIMVILGLTWRKTKPKTAKILFIIAGIYFLIGAGICGALLR